MRFCRRITLLTFILSLALTGCETDNEVASDKITIVFWHSLVSSSVPALEALIEKFEQQHPKIKIRAQYVPTGEALIQKLIAAIQSKTAPDVSWIHSHYLENLVEADAIYKVAHFLNDSPGFPPEELQEFFPALLQAASWQGTLYAMPMEATDLALLYNKDMFRAAGLDPERPPQTWQELQDYAKRLTLDKDGDGRFEQVGFFVPIYPASGSLSGWMVWQWMPFLWQAGGYLIDEEQTRMLFNSQAGVRALTLWKGIFEEMDLSSFTVDYDVAFASKNLAMALDGPWNLPRYKDLLKNIDWGIAPLPAGPVKRATNVGGEYLAIFKQSSHPREAWQFVQWIVQPETQAFWSMQSGYLPVRRDVLDIPEFNDYLNEHPQFKVFVEEMKVGQSPRPIDFHALEINRNIAAAIEKATIGHRDPKIVLDEAVRESNKLLQSAAAELSQE